MIDSEKNQIKKATTTISTTAATIAIATIKYAGHPKLFILLHTTEETI
jgi:hypothetical protein